MVYRVLGLMSGSSLDGLDLCYAHLQEASGKWTYDIIKADCYAYDEAWITKLKQAIGLSAREYLLLHVEYGHYLGQLVKVSVGSIECADDLAQDDVFETDEELDAFLAHVQATRHADLV